MNEPNVEALARALAFEDVQDWITGDRWYGYPNGDDEEAEAVEDSLPRARKKALRYLRIAGVVE